MFQIPKMFQIHEKIAKISFINSKVYTNYKKHTICTNFINFNKLFKAKKNFSVRSNRIRILQLTKLEQKRKCKHKSFFSSLYFFIQSTLYIGIWGLHRLFGAGIANYEINNLWETIHWSIFEVKMDELRIMMGKMLKSVQLEGEVWSMGLLSWLEMCFAGAFDDWLSCRVDLLMVPFALF